MKLKHARKRLGLPVLPAVMIASGVGSAHALELGTVNVHSSLGQPLRASIAYALAPNEAIDGYCVSLAPASRQGGMPSVSQADITVSNGLITITGKAAIADPLLTASLKVNCPYTPAITREYMLFVDPAAREGERLHSATGGSRTRFTERAVRPSVEPPVAIAAGSTYRVRPGDSLAKIVRRLQGSNSNLWPAVDAIFARNPQAFIDADPNRLRAGALLRIPQTLAGNEDVVRPGAINPPIATQPAAPVAQVAQTAGDAGSIAPLAPVAGDATKAGSEEAIRRLGRMAVASDLLDSDGYTAADALVTPGAKPVTAFEPVNGTAREPAVVSEPLYAADYAGGSNSVWWTLGAALAAIAGLLVRRRRGRVDREDVIAAAVARVERPPRHLDEPSIEVEIIGMPEARESLDYDLSDDSPTEENPILNASQIDGQGMGKHGMNVRVDSSENLVLDLDLSEAVLAEPEECETDIIPPPDRSAGSILESEVLPEADDYELSVVVDVTKMPMPEEATERDLKAVVVDEPADSALSAEVDGYTLSQEVDYQILEQDYEDELTATQALNIEIERAARELTRHLDGELTIDTELLAREETMAVPVADITRLDLAAASCADNDDVSAGEDAVDTALITTRLDAGVG